MMRLPVGKQVFGDRPAGNIWMLPAKAGKVYGKLCRYGVAYDNHTS